MLACKGIFAKPSINTADKSPQRGDSLRTLRQQGVVCLLYHIALPLSTYFPEQNNYAQCLLKTAV